MPTRSSLLLAALFICAASNSISAQSIVVAPNSSFTLGLDSENARFSEWVAEDLRGLNAMEAQVTFVRKGKDRQWAPGFWVSLGNDEELARLSAVALPQSGPLIMETKRFADNQAEVLSAFALTPEFEEEFRLRIQWDNEGAVSFTVFSEAAQAVNGYESHTVQLKQPPSELVIGGSTGEVIFNPLQLGTLPNS